MTTVCRHQETFNQFAIHAFPIIRRGALIAIQGHRLIKKAIIKFLIKTTWRLMLHKFPNNISQNNSYEVLDVCS